MAGTCPLSGTWGWIVERYREYSLVEKYWVGLGCKINGNTHTVERLDEGKGWLKGTKVCSVIGN